MHRAETALVPWVNHELQSTSCDRLKPAIALSAAADLIKDAQDYSYSGIVSLCEAIASMKRDGFSWGIVKAYYASFYLLRSYLASKNIALFYRDNTYWYAECIDKGELTRSLASSHSSHSSVIHAFKKQSFARNILQTEDELTIVDKLKQLREQANYTQSPIGDPNPLVEIKPLSDNFKAAQVLGAYGRDPLSYAYVDGHSLLAFPIFIWLKVKEEMAEKGQPIAFSEPQRKHLLKYIESFNCKHEFELSLLNLKV